MGGCFEVLFLFCHLKAAYLFSLSLTGTLSTQHPIPGLLVIFRQFTVCDFEGWTLVAGARQAALSFAADLMGLSGKTIYQG